MTVSEFTPSTSNSHAKMVVSANPEGDSVIPDDNTIHVTYRTGTGGAFGALEAWTTKEATQRFDEAPSQSIINALRAAESRIQELEVKLGPGHGPEDQGNGDWASRYDMLLNKAERYTQEEIAAYMASDVRDRWAVNFQTDLDYPAKNQLSQIPDATIYSDSQRICLPPTEYQGSSIGTVVQD